METEKIYDVRDKLKKVYKQSNCSMDEFGKYLIKYGMQMCQDAAPVEPSVYSEEEKYEFIDDKDLNDLDVVWNSMIEQMIEYLNTHPNVIKEIENDQTKLTTKYKDMLTIRPDISFSVSADGLEESIKSGFWTPATDSCLTINVGNKSVITRY